MREDMPRVIVHRPRLGGGPARKGRAVPLDDLPKQEGMRRPYVIADTRKMLNENLSPLRRYLESQVGRPWNKIYSEIALHLRSDNTVQQHVRDHLSDFVALRPRRRSKPLDDRFRFQSLYVDPKDGLLKRIDQLRGAKPRAAPPMPPDRIGLSADRELRRIDGQWFEVTMAPLPDPDYRTVREMHKILLKPYDPESPAVEMQIAVRRLASPAVRDAVSGALVPAGPEIDEERAWRDYRRAHPDRRYAVARRTLSRAELRRHGLSNR